MALTRETLDKLLGKNIADICDQGFKANDENHCAHFVGHVLDLRFGYRCGRHAGKANEGVCIRVHELFARCPSIGKWSDLGNRTECLAFVTQTGNVNVKHKTMSNVPKKHVGIYLNGSIWHYSNRQDRVVSQTPAEFGKHYSGSGFGVFWGTFPV